MSLRDCYRASLSHGAALHEDRPSQETDEAATGAYTVAETAGTDNEKGQPSAAATTEKGRKSGVARAVALRCLRRHRAREEASQSLACEVLDFLRGRREIEDAHGRCTAAPCSFEAGWECGYAKFSAVFGNQWI